MKLPRLDLDRLRALPGLRSIPLHLSGRQRKFARWAGMGLIAIVSFLVTLKFTFPYERMKGKLVDALSEKYDVTVDDVGGGFLPGTVVFDRVVLRSRPSAPGEKVSEIVIDEVVLDLGLDFGLLGALRKRAAFDIEAELNGGQIEAEVEMSSSLFETRVETEGLALGNLPGVASAVGLPMSGSLDAEIELRLPGGKWKNAEGRIVLDCDGCTVGDGVSKMTMTPSATSSSRRRRSSAGAAAYGATGVTVPRLNLGETEVVVEISKGVGEIKTFAATSADGWLKIEGKIEFRDPFANSLFPGCMRFKLSDQLKQRARDFGNIEYTLSEKMRQADGSYALPTKGRLTELRWDVRRKCGGGSTEEDGDGRGADRPGLAGRPSLESETPRPGGAPIDPAQVPGVSGAPVEPDPGGAPPAVVEGEMPAPGTSGPPLTDPNAQPADQTGAPPPPPQPVHDAGAVPPPVPPEQQQFEQQQPEEPAPGDDGTGGLRRLRPAEEERPPEGFEPPPPEPPPSNEPPPLEQGTDLRPPAETGESPPRNQGEPSRDQGGPPRDQGEPPRDQGEPPRDQGEPPRDQGEPPRNQGEPLDRDEPARDRSDASAVD